MFHQTYISSGFGSKRGFYVHKQFYVKYFVLKFANSKPCFYFCLSFQNKTYYNLWNPTFLLSQ